MRETIGWLLLAAGAACSIAFMVRSSRHHSHADLTSDASYFDREQAHNDKLAKDPVIAVLTLVGLACIAAGMYLVGMFD